MKTPNGLKQALRETELRMRRAIRLDKRLKANTFIVVERQMMKLTHPELGKCYSALRARQLDKFTEKANRCRKRERGRGERGRERRGREEEREPERHTLNPDGRVGLRAKQLRYRVIARKRGEGGRAWERMPAVKLCDNLRIVGRGGGERGKTRRQVNTP